MTILVAAVLPPGTQAGIRVGGGSGSAGETKNPPNIPEGFTPVGDGSKYMRDSGGKFHLTPDWQKKVDTGEIDWLGVAGDLAWITTNSVAGVLANLSKFAAGALAVGLNAFNQLHDQDQKPNP